MERDASAEQTEIKGRMGGGFWGLAGWGGGGLQGLGHEIISVPYFALTPVSQHRPPSEDVWSHLGLGGHFPLKIAHL